MLRIGSVLGIAALLLAGGCGGKKKDDGDKAKTQGATAAGGAGGAGAAGGGAAGAGGAASASTAAGGEVGGGTTVTECPKSLAGTDEVSRVITKDCGVVTVTGEYSVEGATLTLEAGSTLAFQDGGRLVIGWGKAAKLVVKGTSEAPVTFTAAGDKAPGVWQGVRLEKHANRSSIEGLVLEYAGAADEGALLVRATDVTLRGTTIRESKGPAIVVEGEGAFAAFADNAFDKVAKSALVVTPEAVGGLGASKFPADAVVQVAGGPLKRSATWKALGAPYLLVDDVPIDGTDGGRATVELAAGVELRFDEDASLGIGWAEAATLKVNGTKEAPVRFTSAERKEPGAWRGLGVYAHGELAIDGAVFEFGGQDEDKGVIFVQAAGTLSVKNTTFRSNAHGLVVSGGDAKIRAFEGNVFEATPRAATLAPDLLGALGANTFDAAARVGLHGGDVKKDATWRAGATVEILDDVAVNAAVTVEAGAAFVVKDGVSISVGWGDAASLKLAGTADKPITFAGLREEAGAWGSLKLFGRAKSCAIDNVVIRHAGEEGGVKVAREAEVKVNGLVCEACAGPAIGWECGAKVTTAGVKAAAGTPKAEARPEGCE